MITASMIAVASNRISLSARPMGPLGPKTPLSHDANRTHDTAINEVRQAWCSFGAACKMISSKTAHAVRRGRIYGLVMLSYAVAPRWGTCLKQGCAAIIA